MIVVSTNIGKRTRIQWRGKDVETGIFKTSVPSIYLGSVDVEGDQVVDRKYHGGIDKASYLYSNDHYSFWKEKYPDLNWEFGMLGENITIDGLDESKMNIGDVYQLGEAIIQIAQPRQPCFKLGIKFGTQLVIKAFINAPYPGVYVKVLEEGKVKAGDKMQLIRANSSHVGLVEVFHLLYHSRAKDRERIRVILDLKILPDECADGLKKRLSLF